jgi:hypothetical protein
MSNKKADWNNAPSEVWGAILIRNLPYIGMNLLDRYDEIVKRHPEYFPNPLTEKEVSVLVKERIKKLT